MERERLKAEGVGGSRRPSRPILEPERFDKAVPVFLTSTKGVANGVGRNVSSDGMFVETADPCPLGSEVRVTFTAPGGTEMTLLGEVRYQCFLNFSGGDGKQEGLRGVGIRFLFPEEDGRPLPAVAQ